MRNAKKQTLPKNFMELLEAGDVSRLQAVFDTCSLDARGGHAKQTALAFPECPDALARWLVSQGADIEAVDVRGNTPLLTRAGSRGSIAVLLELGANVNATGSAGTALHAAARTRHTEHARQLLAHGALVDAPGPDGLTPLEVAIGSCTNAELPRVPEFVDALLEAGAVRTQAVVRFVERAGETFEFHRDAFNPKTVDAASAALESLYRTFGVRPVPRRHTLGAADAIVVKGTSWQAQHAELWDLLVPSRGAARTVQGEVIRITGRISDEWERNGGANWDRAHARMALDLASHLQLGQALTSSELAEIGSIVDSLQEREGAGHERLAELAVAWVLMNPQQLPLETETGEDPLRA